MKDGEMKFTGYAQDGKKGKAQEVERAGGDAPHANE